MFKLAAIFLIGYFLFNWTVFLLTLLFASTDDPLWWGITSGLVLFLSGGVILRKKLKNVLKFRRFSWLEWFFLAFSLVFSFWLMGKSFGYQDGYFKIASNIFDDFNIHLGVMRSFSWGHNFPPQNPFFVGESLRYHFMNDFGVAVLASLGLNPGWAFNLPSALAFVSLLTLIYILSQKLTGGGMLVGFFSVVLFLFNSSLTWLKFFQQLSNPWQLRSYLSAGPFDGGLIAVFWNLNTYLNQRHLIFSAGLFLLIIFLLSEKRKTRPSMLLLAGVLAGLLPLWHGLVFLAVLIAGFFLIKPRRFFLFLVPTFLLALPQFLYLSGGISRLPLIRPGFLVAQNLSLVSLAEFWGANLGLSLLTIPAGWLIVSKEKRWFIFPFLSLFLVANLFQFTPNMFHNHSLLNLSIIGFNFFSAFFLVWLLKKGKRGMVLSGLLFFFLTFSGFFDLMVIKNDFLHLVADQPRDKLVDWIVKETTPDEVFLISVDSLYSPVNLAGRKVFLTSEHFVWGYGHQIIPRQILTKNLASSDNQEEVVDLVRETGVNYWLTDRQGFSLPIVYQDENRVLYQIKE